MRRVFYSSSNHFRVIWRIIFYLLFGVLFFLPFILILKCMDWFLPPIPDNEGPASIINLIFVSFLNISFVLAAWFALKKIDHRPPALLGLNFWSVGLKELIIGMGIGLANFALIFLTLLAFGWISVEWVGFAITDAEIFLLYLASFLVFAAFEELINRGYIFQTLCEGVGVWTAVIIVNLIFSLVHVVNPAFSILGGVFLFIHGLMYTIVYLKTRSLWGPIGLHMAWNFAQGPIAGINVSGTAVDKSLFLSEISGPDVMTGGSFGAEGGLVAIIISIILLIVLLKAPWLKPSERFLKIEKEWMNNRN